MKRINLKKIAGVSVLGLAVLAGGAETANAQNRGNDRQSNQIIKQQQKVAKQRAKLEQERLKLERQRLQNQRVAMNRYRVNRNGRYYNTDQRGAELLRQAVNAGYQQGFRAGQQDRSNRRNSSWNNSSIYRSGTYGYQSHVDRSQYQYYFQQGFQKGYQDGYNSRNQYGYVNNGSVNILGTILSQILNIQQY